MRRVALGAEMSVVWEAPVVLALPLTRLEVGGCWAFADGVIANATRPAITIAARNNKTSSRKNRIPVRMLLRKPPHRENHYDGNQDRNPAANIVRKSGDNCRIGMEDRSFRGFRATWNVRMTLPL